MPSTQRDLTNLFVSESYYRLLQTDPVDDSTLLDGTGSLVTLLAVSGTVDAFYFKGDGSQLTNIGASSLPTGIVSSSSQTITHLIGTNIISSSSQRGVLGLASTDSPRRGWDLEEWSDNEILQDLDDLQDLEFLNKVLCVRNDRWSHKNLNWDEHVRQLLHEDSFENEYGMSLNCHRELVRILYPILQKKEYNL